LGLSAEQDIYIFYNHGSYQMTPILSFLLGILVGGVACAVSAKTLGWFNRQVTSVEKKV
jgi:hypothetical protein